MNIILSWILNTVAVIAAAYILPGVSVAGFMAAFVVALVLGILNTFIRPLLIALTLPINVLTLGLFTLVINTALVMAADAIVPGFAIANFWWALLFGLVLSIITYILHRATPDTSREWTHATR